MEEEDDYSSSVVLGISDALIEMTGILAGLTFAFQDMSLIALSGMVTGVAASYSMGASEFLSQRAEPTGGSPLKAAFSTWAAYFAVVLVLISPYLLISQGLGDLDAHLVAFAVTLMLGVGVVAAFNGWLTSKQGVPFLPRFIEMLSILAFITLLSYALGLVLGNALSV